MRSTRPILRRHVLSQLAQRSEPWPAPRIASPASASSASVPRPRVVRHGRDHHPNGREQGRLPPRTAVPPPSSGCFVRSRRARLGGRRPNRRQGRGRPHRPFRKALAAEGRIQLGQNLEAQARPKANETSRERRHASVCEPPGARTPQEPAPGETTKAFTGRGPGLELADNSREGGWIPRLRSAPLSAIPLQAGGGARGCTAPGARRCWSGSPVCRPGRERHRPCGRLSR